MKQLLFLLVTLISLNLQAQISYCESNMTYTSGNYYVYDVALGAGSNNLDDGYSMTPLYVYTTTLLDTWEDSCFGGPCTHTVYNEYNEDTITTCISYTLTDSFDNVDTLECCITHYWDGNVWSIISDTEMNCENLGITVTSSSESSINMTSNAEFCMDQSLGPFTYSWSAYSTDGDFIVWSSNEYLNTYLDNNISLTDSIDICFGLTAANGDICEVCDTLFYNGPINEWISINAENIAVDLDCEDIELNISSSNDYQIIMNSNANETEGVFVYYWLVYDFFDNIISSSSSIVLDQNMSYDSLNVCISIVDEYDENCDVCETIYWSGESWSMDTNDIYDVTDYLYTICDTLEVISEVSTEEWVILSTNLFFLDYLNSNNLLDEISFNWESWGNDLVSESSSNIIFYAPNSEEDYYFILEILYDENGENSTILCQHPFLINWNPNNYMWQPLSIQMNQLPTSIDSYHNELQNKKLVKITDVFGREVKEEKNNLLFYTYEDGSVIKTYIIK